MDVSSSSFAMSEHCSRSCHNKCIPARYADGELNKGEQVCIDRCVAKYNDVQKKVGEKIQSRSAANAGSSGFGPL
ncbi:mitochondrial import inner membrane translocase subunit Tim10 [Desarmillaria tabescens]|uniref:Mitochondrial import inner membrane translocase subunit n=1 Tax=Armillaria tabescens TaxID=1929756 RepID=A0AA39TNR2_ARMTA|nr:mitochondrial import inner membrane translocase subunit Tim10 [Desarmillaria tabescens]KAK0465327.1 mitochondrial import inner membrane translocase subunit Tim10 [Desarmillaria tabescens]